MAFQFQCLAWKLEIALRNLSYDQFDISEEVQEQVNLAREQLRRATERYGGSVASCPKTQHKLDHLTLTPNDVLRSLITRWCVKHNVDQPTALVTGRLKRSDGTYSDVSGKIAVIQGLVCKLSSHSIEECRETVTEIRTLSKQSTGNRILIGEAGAIQILVKLLISEDSLTQENAVISILNLSLYHSNKGRVILAGAVPYLIQVLRAGSMETRENAAATLFSLSLAEENKIIIGASDAIPALVDLLLLEYEQCGSNKRN